MYRFLMSNIRLLSRVKVLHLCEYVGRPLLRLGNGSGRSSWDSEWKGVQGPFGERGLSPVTEVEAVVSTKGGRKVKQNVLIPTLSICNKIHRL